MAIWGIGANYNDPNGKRRNVLTSFLASGRAYIGYSQAQAPSLHRMLGTIKAGDIIYVKSFWAKKVNIKALGIVTDPMEKRLQAFVLHPRWPRVQKQCLP